MDALDRLAEPGLDLLHRVDAALMAAGAPAGDPIWPLLRRVGALPGDALEFGLRLDVPAMRTAAADVRVHADTFADRRARLTADLTAGTWEGAGAEAFHHLWGALAGHIGDGSDPATICGRLRATAGYADALADWATDLRHDLAEATARAISSREAVTIRGAGPDTSPSGALEAAARLGMWILRPVAAAVGKADELRADWSPRLAELHWTAPAEQPAGSPDTITRVSI